MELLKLAKQRGIHGVLGRAEALPFKSSSFDLVLMVVSVCFFEEPLRAFEEAHRVLKNDGYLVLGLVLSDSPWADFYKEKAKRGTSYLLPRKVLLLWRTFLHFSPSKLQD
jgi:SAM-dependent methyltransferase